MSLPFAPFVAHTKGFGNGSTVYDGRLLDTSATSHLEDLTGDIRSKGTGEEEDGCSSLLSVTWSSKRNVGNRSDRLLLRVAAGGTARDAKSDLLAVDLDGSAGLLGLSETRVDPAESDAVDTNTERTPLLAHGLGQTKHARLGGRVVDLPDVAVCTRGGGDVDDGHVLTLALVLDAEVGGGSTDDAEGSGDVAVEHELEGGVVGGVRHLVSGESGVVDNDVELSPLVDGGLDYTLAKVLVHDVASEGDGRSSSLCDLGCNILRFLRVEVRDDDVGAVAGEELCGSFADTLTSTGDDSDLTLEEGSSCKRLGPSG